MGRTRRELRGAACHPKGAEVALPSGSYTSAPGDNLDPPGVGTDTPDHPPAIGTDPHSRPAPRLAPEECAELQPRHWQPGHAWQASDVGHSFCCTSSGQLPSSPSSTSSDSSPPSPGTSVSFPPNASPARAALGAGPRASVGAPGWPGDATPDLVTAGSTVPDAMSSAPPDAVLPSDDASEASDASVATVSSSNCDPQSPDEVPVIAAPDLAAVFAAQDVTDVLLADLNAPLVTISLEEKALAPAAPLLRVPYLERLLEAVRDGTPLNHLPDALRPAVIQAHDDLATYITELVLALFDGDQLRGLQGQLQPFRGLADPLTVRRAVLSQMRYVADVASSLPSNAYSTSGGLFRLAWRTCKGRALTLRLRTVFIFVPQPVAACLAARRRPELASILLPEQPPSACS